MNDNHEKLTAPDVSSVRYMNAFERANARQRMEQAMALADWSIRAWDGIRAVFDRVGNVLRRAFAQQRQRAKAAVAYRE